METRWALGRAINMRLMTCRAGRGAGTDTVASWSVGLGGQVGLRGQASDCVDRLECGGGGRLLIRTRLSYPRCFGELGRPGSG